MPAISCAEVPVVISGDRVELRGQEIGGEMTVGFVRLPRGTDLGPALARLPGDLCPCPHWGYIVSGRIELRSKHRVELATVGQAFHWSPGHAPIALEDTQYVDFSPTRQLAPVVAHLTRSPG
jgi:hypothetical protein